MSEVIALDAAGQPGVARYAALAETLRRRVVRGDWPPAPRCRPSRPWRPSMAWRWAPCAAPWNCWWSRG